MDCSSRGKHEMNGLVGCANSCPGRDITCFSYIDGSVIKTNDMDYRTKVAKCHRNGLV